MTWFKNNWGSVAYEKTTQTRQLHCPCSFFRGSQQRCAICLAREGGLPLLSGSLPVPSAHPTILLPPSQGTSAELCPVLALFSASNRIFILFRVSCLPCPLWFFCSETYCFFKALQQQAFDNLLVLSQVYIKAQQWSRISYSGCGTDFSFQRCGWFAVFPKHTYVFHRTALQKGKNYIVSQFMKNSTPGHRKHVLCHIWTTGQEKLGGKK